MHLVIFAGLVLRVFARSQLSSPTRIAWAFVLFALPFVGPILYLLFGEVQLGRSVTRRYKAALDATHGAVLASGAQSDVARWGQASAYATSINGFGVTEGNRGQLMPTAEVARQTLIDDIDAAEESVSLLYYIWLEDHTGRATAEALIRAAQRGVKCRAIVDAVGSRRLTLSQLWKDMQAAGIETVISLPIDNPLRTMLSRRLDLRQHRKISVIDGRVGYCGSQNCADAEFLPKRKFAPWVDMVVRLEGPIVAQLQLLFAQDWLVSHPDTPVSEFVSTPEQFSGGLSAQAIGTGPTIGRDITAQLFMRLIFEARRELILTTPYFVPGDAVCAAICGAAQAGVKVTLTVPRRNDSAFVARASRAYYPRLVRAGVKIVEFNGGLLHTKAMTIDGEMAFFGSSNMDFRSFDLDFENDLLVRDTALVGDIRARQQDYIAASTPVSPDYVLGWPVSRRIWLNAFATVGPLL